MSCVDRVSHHGLTTAVRRLLWLAFILLGFLLISAILGARAHADEQPAAEPESTTDSAGASLVGDLVDDIAEEAERAGTSAVEAGAEALAPAVEPVAETVEPVVSPLVEPIAEPVLEPVVDEVAPVLAPVTGPVAEAGAGSVDPVTGALGVDEAIEPLTTAPQDEALPSQPEESIPEGRSDLRDHALADHSARTVDPLGRDDRGDPVLSLPVNSAPAGPSVAGFGRGSAQAGDADDWSSVSTAVDEESPATGSMPAVPCVPGTPTAGSSPALLTAVVPGSARTADGACGWGLAARDLLSPMSCAMEPETRPG